MVSGRRIKVVLGDAVFGIVVAGALLGLSLLAVDIRRLMIDPNHYMIVNAVHVPDHVTGDDPLIVYDREVFRDFRAEWVVEIKRVSDGLPEPVCWASGTNEYSPRESVGEVRLYGWYLGRGICPLAPGQYIIKTVWRADNGLVIRNASNVFQVYDIGEE